MPTANLTDKRWIERARQLYEEEGDIEFDDDPVVSRNDDGDDGCYVQAWVWVPNPEPEEADVDSQRAVIVSTEVRGEHRDFEVETWEMSADGEGSATLYDRNDVETLTDYLDQHDVGLSPHGTFAQQVTDMISLVAEGSVKNANLVVPVSNTDDMTIHVRMETETDD